MASASADAPMHATPRYAPHIALIAVTSAGFLLLLYPTFYRFDSAELTIGAATLGIVHAPGYALYTLIAHLFTLVPLGDVGWRVNLFSAACVIAAAPLLYAALARIAQNRIAALATTGFFVWTLSIWSSGTIAEVYAPQLVTLALCLYALTRLVERVTRTTILGAAVSFGVAVAMHPSSALFAPAVALAFIARRVPARWCIGAGLLAGAIFAASLLYFPARQQAHPALNLAGMYAADGTFQPVDLSSIGGLWWLVSGRQFAAYFPISTLPSAAQVGQTAGYVWTNFLGIGAVLGIIGLVVMAWQRGLLWVWLAAFVPYTFFYTVYGAPDRETMLGPTYLLWCVPLCFGLTALENILPKDARRALLLLPLIPLALNLPAMIERNRLSARDEAQATLDALPREATVFGLWGDLMPVQYLQIVEGQRADLDLRNLILFDSRETVAAFVGTLLPDPARRPIIFLGTRAPIGLDTTRFDLVPLRSDREVTLGYEVRRR